MIKPYLDAANVDLKGFSDDSYRKNCKARLQPVLDTHSRHEGTGHLAGGDHAGRPRRERLGRGTENRSPTSWPGSTKTSPGTSAGSTRTTGSSNMRPRPSKPCRGRGKSAGERACVTSIWAMSPAKRIPIATVAGRRPSRRRYMGTERTNLENGRCPSCGTAIPGVWSGVPARRGTEGKAAKTAGDDFRCRGSQRDPFIPARNSLPDRGRRENITECAMRTERLIVDGPVSAPGAYLYRGHGLRRS